MSKRIKRVFCEEADPVLLKNVANGEPLNELFGIFKKKQKADPDDPANFASKPGENTSGSATEQVLKAIFSIPSGEQRVILYLSDSDLSNIYQPNRGNINLADALDGDDQLRKKLEAAFRPSDSSLDSDRILFLVGSNFDLSKLKDGVANNAVLLNVKTGITKNLAPGPTVPKEQYKDLFAKITDHRNYIGVISVKNAKKIRSSLLSSTDIDKLAKSFNMRTMLKGFNPSITRSGAISEWDAAQQPKEPKASKKSDEPPPPDPSVRPPSISDADVIAFKNKLKHLDLKKPKDKWISHLFSPPLEKFRTDPAAIEHFNYLMQQHFNLATL